jgi:hypothetical protein
MTCGFDCVLRHPVRVHPPVAVILLVTALGMPSGTTQAAVQAPLSAPGDSAARGTAAGLAYRCRTASTGRAMQEMGDA